MDYKAQKKKNLETTWYLYYIIIIYKHFFTFILEVELSGK